MDFRRIAFCVVALMASWTSFAQDIPVPGSSACEPYPVKGAIQEAELTLVGLTPKSGSAVTRSSVVTASLRYRVPNYVPGHYKVVAQIATTREGVTIDGAFPDEAWVSGCGESGVFSIYFPLAYIWDDARVVKPIRMMFVLLEGPGPRTRGIAITDWVEFPAAK
jgi:hypothetical protein